MGQNKGARLYRVLIKHGIIQYQEVRQLIIDFHVHCFPDLLAGSAVPKIADLAGIPARLNGTVSDLKRSMAKAGITHSVIQHIATRPSQVRSINDFAASVCSQGIYSFGTLHPDYDDWKSEIVRIKELGLKGIKFHPDYQKFFLDEVRMFPIYEKVFEEDLIALFHAGFDIGLPTSNRSMPDRLSHVLDAFPEAKIVAAHMGGHSVWKAVEEQLVGRSLYFDTSFSLDFIKEDQFKRIIKNHGYKKILFGTDSPWTDQSEEVKRISSLGLKPEELDDIIYNNAARLLKI